MIRTPFFDVFASLALTVRRLDLATVTVFALLFGQSHAMSFNFAAPVLYLGGNVRQFALTDGKVTAVLGYHGSYNKRTHVVNAKKSSDYFLDMTDGKMDAEFVERFVRLENQKGLMRFFHPVQRGKPDNPLVMLCLGDEDRFQRYEQCERLPDIDALSKGVVTTWGVYELATPPSVSRKKETVKSWDSVLQSAKEARTD